MPLEYVENAGFGNFQSTLNHKTTTLHNYCLSVSYSFVVTVDTGHLNPLAPEFPFKF